ncbi:glutathione peroxidase [Filimonas lacunae]|nr:glutathione peroxidase [Filimonas lacunae]BAV09902.1 glutathione peroxidase family protein [Filimonas lacunae]
MKLTRLLGVNNRIQYNTNEAVPPASFYALQTVQNNGVTLSFEQFKGKQVLLVNTASGCGWTAQYTQLQQLHQQYPQLVILGFPANDFKEQEKGSDAEIAQFCQVNFGVTFPLMKKSVVIKDVAQSEVFKWLSDASLNGWNNIQPEWNFSKYLVNEQGSLQYYFGPSISPLSTTVTQAITH